MLACRFTFAGAFGAFTGLRPFLEARAQVTVTQLSLLLAAAALGASRRRLQGRD